MRTTFLTLFAIAFLFACGKKGDDSAQVIAQLEADYNAAYTPAKAKKLIEAYREAAKKQPENHALNLQYLTKAAEIQFNKIDDAVSACRWLDEAVAHHSEGQNLTDAVGLYAQIWNSYLYKAAPAVRLDPDDIDKMRANLTKNAVWMDSSLARLDKVMSANPTAIDKGIAKKYIEIAEAAANIAKPANPDKYVDLTMRAAAVAKTVENFNKATSLYFNIQHELPAHPKAPTALFMMGFVYENDLQDLPKAKAAYEEFLQRFPSDKDYADDAQMALKNLGKSPEELIKEFERQNPKSKK